MTKIKIEIKNRLTGKILFEYEKENNTVKDTVVEAVSRVAYLSGADLCGADLSGAYLRGADLRGADLRGADLSVAYLSGADLRGAYLSGADLCGADLSGAYLRGADLSGAYLCDADLRGADLSVAYLSGADLRGAKNIPYIPLACPTDGEFIAWKKVTEPGIQYLVKLLIPADAKRSSATTNKCRCDKAKVLDILNLDGSPSGKDAVYTDNHGPKTEYCIGEMVYPDSFDENRYNECSHGIHFFINKQDAINY